MQSNFNKLKPQTGLLVFFIYFALALSVAMVFLQVRNFDFVHYDDNVYVFENQYILNGLTSEGVLWAFTSGHAANWHPLTWLSLMLDCQLFGPDPGRLHLVNVFLHLANTLLLFAVLKKMTGSLWPSAFVAAAFALHPMHVESVAWIAQRKDVLSAFFLLLTLLAYAGYTQRPSVYRYLAGLAAFALGLMAKPMLVTLPFLLLLLDYWPLNRLEVPWRSKISGRKSHKSTPARHRRATLLRVIVEKIPYFVLSAVSGVITFLTQQAGGIIVDIKSIPSKDRVGNVFFSYAAYMGKMLWPQKLAVFYPFNAVRSIPLWQFVLYALLLAAVSYLVLRFGRKRKYLPVGWFWFVGTLIPVIGLVRFTGSSHADRFTYIPYIGLFIMIAWGLAELVSRWPYRKLILGVPMVIVLTAMGIRAHRQVGFWNNSITLFSHALEVTQDNPLACYNLGTAYYDLGRYREAIQAYKRAIRTKPDYFDAWYNLGNACTRLGGYHEAIEAFKQAIAIKPDFAYAHSNLGAAYGRVGRYREAIEALKQAIAIEPDHLDAWFNLGNVYASLGRYREAMETFEQATRIKPDDPFGWCNLGNAYGSLGRHQEAIEAYKQAIRIKPDYTDPCYNLAVTYLNIGDKPSALQQYETLKTLDADMAEQLFNIINK